MALSVLENDASQREGLVNRLLALTKEINDDVDDSEEGRTN